MKRICKYAIAIILCFASLFMGAFLGMIEISASSYLASGFYRSDFTKGIGYSGPTAFYSNLGYSRSTYSNSTSSNWKSVTENSEVEFIHTHGANGYFTLSSSTDISGNMIQSMSFSDTPKLVYISACYAGNNSTTYGNVGQALVNKGVDSVVAFTSTISATSSTNGIHKFNLKVAIKLCYNHNNLSTALSNSLAEIYAEDGEYWGANNKVVYGSNYISF
ncbi:CHAT domain-containing protein [Eubacterium ruminantium]|nr:CHAT domain-containing protein [Eubacterium ruminantium]